MGVSLVEVHCAVGAAIGDGEVDVLADLVELASDDGEGSCSISEFADR